MSDQEPLLEVMTRGQCGVWGLPGVLAISAGTVEFEFVSGRRLFWLPVRVRARRPPVLMRARWLPAGLNGALMISDGVVTVSASLWWEKSRQVIEALDAAEIDYQSRETRLSIGFLEGVRGHPRHWWL